MVVKLSGEVVSTSVRSYRTRDGEQREVGQTYLLPEGGDAPVKVEHPSAWVLEPRVPVSLEVVIRPARFGGGLSVWGRSILSVPELAL